MDAAKEATRVSDWIRTRISAAGAKGAVVGLSGGVDSAVVAGLAARAVPGCVRTFILPCYSQPIDAQLATEVAAALDLPVETIVLDGAFDLLRTAYGSDGPAKPGLMADANLKSRLRMITLYYQANRLNHFVLGTGNRSEIAVGYFTKWGDGAVDLLPLGNFVKGEVYELARHLGVPQAVIDRSPTGGLWAGQTDEDEMGIKYAVIDRYLLTGEAEPGVKEKIERRIALNDHKRHMPPIA